jgi:hypothetical protein
MLQRDEPGSGNSQNSRGFTPTPSCQPRLKARVDLGDQTAEFIPFEVISTAILTYFHLTLGTNVRILVSALSTGCAETVYYSKKAG